MSAVTTTSTTERKVAKDTPLEVFHAKFKSFMESDAMNVHAAVQLFSLNKHKIAAIGLRFVNPSIAVAAVNDLCRSAGKQLSLRPKTWARFTNKADAWFSAYGEAKFDERATWFKGDFVCPPARDAMAAVRSAGGKGAVIVLAISDDKNPLMANFSAYPMSINSNPSVQDKLASLTKHLDEKTAVQVREQMLEAKAIQEVLWRFRDDATKPDPATEKAAAKATLAKLTEPKCADCGAEEAKLQCSKCKCARYCNQSCQKRHWPTHKPICQVTPYKIDRLLGIIARSS